MQTDTVICPGCAAALPDNNKGASENYNASGECEALFYELSGYTLSINDPGFIHQYIVDAYGAQHAGVPTNNIRVIFSLAGLYLATEHNYTGRQVQLVHMKIPKQIWPDLAPPDVPAPITVADVINTNTEEEKIGMIEKWARSVWESWWQQHNYIREITARYI